MADGHEHGPPSVDPVWTQRIIWITYAICAAFVLIDIIAWFTHVPFHKHGHYDFEQIPGFHAIYGFVSCVVLVIAATQMRLFLMRGEDYYDE